MTSRVVVVDDSALVAEQVCDGLRAAGCEARAAGDVDSTLRLVRELGPHVVLVDVHMPGLSLAELCARVREASGAARVAICLLSGVPEAELTIRAREVGADGFVSKVAGLPHVVAQVRRIAAESR
jgi:two-component system response regulator MtrA